MFYSLQIQRSKTNAVFTSLRLGFNGIPRRGPGKTARARENFCPHIFSIISARVQIFNYQVSGFERETVSRRVVRREAIFFSSLPFVPRVCIRMNDRGNDRGRNRLESFDRERLHEAARRLRWSRI